MKNVEPIRDIVVVNDIADYLKARSERDYIMFMLGIYLGYRISDMLKLRVRDLRGKDYITITTSKKDKVVRLPINKELKEILDDYFKESKPGIF